MSYYDNDSARNCLVLIELIAEKYGAALCELPPLHVAHPGTARRLTEHQRKRIVELYHQNKRVCEIAAEVDCGRDSVTKILRKNGIWIGHYRRNQLEHPGMREAVREFFATERTLCKGAQGVIAAKYGIPVDQFRNKIGNLRRTGAIKEYLGQEFSPMTVVPARRIA